MAQPIPSTGAGSPCRGESCLSAGLGVGRSRARAWGRGLCSLRAPARQPAGLASVSAACQPSHLQACPSCLRHCVPGVGGRWAVGAQVGDVLPSFVLRLTREPVAESPKKKRWEAPSSLHPPRGAGATTRGGAAQSQRGTPGGGGASRARGSSFAKFGNRNVFMKDHSSSSSTDSRSRSSSRSPSRHFRRRCPWALAAGRGGPMGIQLGPHLPASSHSDSHSDSDSSYSGNECQPVGRRNPPPKGRGGRGAHMDRGRGRAQRGKR